MPEARPWRLVSSCGRPDASHNSGEPLLTQNALCLDLDDMGGFPPDEPDDQVGRRQVSHPSLRPFNEPHVARHRPVAESQVLEFGGLDEAIQVEVNEGDRRCSSTLRQRARSGAFRQCACSGAVCKRARSDALRRRARSGALRAVRLHQRVRRALNAPSNPSFPQETASERRLPRPQVTSKVNDLQCISGRPRSRQPRSDLLGDLRSRGG